MTMRRGFFALCGAIVLTACGQPAPNPYPAEAQSQFEASCPPSSKVCACTWDQITRAMKYEDYQAALERYNSRGLMDPRITHARTVCLERGGD
jgi:hypothetical protein